MQIFSLKPVAWNQIFTHSAVGSIPDSNQTFFKPNQIQSNTIK